MTTPYLLFGLAGLALLTAMWVSVRRPNGSLAPRLRVAWHAVRVAVAASTASLSALFVLLGVAQLQ